MNDMSGRRQHDFAEKILEDRSLLTDMALVQHPECPWIDMRFKDLAVGGSVMEKVH